jgi:hypothetical protein
VLEHIALAEGVFDGVIMVRAGFPQHFVKHARSPWGGSRVTLFCCGDKIRGEGLALALLHLLLLTLPGVALGGRLGGILLSLPVALVLMEEGLDSLLTQSEFCGNVHQFVRLGWGLAT